MVLMWEPTPVPEFTDINGDNKIDLLVVGTGNGFLKFYLNESTDESTIVFTAKDSSKR